ncbi:MAG: hypothetical protein KIS66_11670 [Fimbriimonadaceae bacterium]|nr:hypothetical protein [Fimbriimonadaceae bacterium]
MVRRFALAWVFVVSFGLAGCGPSKPEESPKPVSGPEATTEQPAPSGESPVAMAEPTPEPKKPAPKVDAVKTTSAMSGLEITEYPGAKPDAGSGAKADTAGTEEFTFGRKTPDAPKLVIEHFAKQLTVEDQYADDAVAYVVGKTKSGHEVNVNAVAENGSTLVTITYVKKKG